MEDAYTYYVLILEIPESLFWNADISFLDGVVANKSAFDGWVTSEQKKEQERARRKRKSRR